MTVHGEEARKCALNNCLLQPPGCITVEIPLSDRTKRKKTKVIPLKIGESNVSTVLGQIDNSIKRFLLEENLADTG